MDNNLLIEKTKAFVKEKCYGEGSGHDWYHIYRVHNTAKFIAEKEGGDLFIIEMTALLHDIDDWKFSEGTETDTTVTERFLHSLNISQEIIYKIITIIKTMSFKGGVADSSQNTIEGMIVQDADRLDAIGAIGIARTFAYGGKKGKLIYEPSNNQLVDEKEYNEKGSNTSISHFYDKLLKIKDLMNTDTAKEIAIERHKFLENFLKEFLDEWNGVK